MTHASPPVGGTRRLFARADTHQAHSNLGHSKTRRFFATRTDAQIMDLIAALDGTLAVTGLNPSTLRTTIMRWVGAQR